MEKEHLCMQTKQDVQRPWGRRQPLAGWLVLGERRWQRRQGVRLNCTQSFFSLLSYRVEFSFLLHLEWGVCHRHLFGASAFFIPGTQHNLWNRKCLTNEWKAWISPQSSQLVSPALGNVPLRRGPYIFWIRRPMAAILTHAQATCPRA